MNQSEAIRSVDDGALAAGAQVERAVLEAARALGESLRDAGLRVATAESCTGGLVAAALTHWPGASDWFEGSVVSYANPVKQQLLRVPGHSLESDGAVSRAVAMHMAEGALQAFPGADAVIAITGVAGPGGGSAEKPVGLVWFAWALRGRGDIPFAVQTDRLLLPGSRAAIRAAAALHALVQLRLRCLSAGGQQTAQA